MAATASGKIRCASIYPGVVEFDLANTISGPVARERMIGCRKMAIQPDAIGRTIQFVIEQPNGLDVNEIVIRPLATQV